MLKDSIGRAVRHIVVDFNNPLVVRIFFQSARVVDDRQDITALVIQSRGVEIS